MWNVVEYSNNSALSQSIDLPTPLSYNFNYYINKYYLLIRMHVDKFQYIYIHTHTWMNELYIYMCVHAYIYIYIYNKNECKIN